MPFQWPSVKTASFEQICWWSDQRGVIFLVTITLGMAVNAQPEHLFWGSSRSFPWNTYKLQTHPHWQGDELLDLSSNQIHLLSQEVKMNNKYIYSSLDPKLCWVCRGHLHLPFCCICNGREKATLIFSNSSSMSLQGSPQPLEVAGETGVKEWSGNTHSISRLSPTITPSSHLHLQLASNHQPSLWFASTLTSFWKLVGGEHFFYLNNYT